jgi:hypothetical protein
LVDQLDPGRLLLDREVELVYRNDSTLRYVFEKNLYSKEGLGARFRALSAAIAGRAPYHPISLEVRFPEESVSIKADWVH